jgi:hypothetical protein
MMRRMSRPTALVAAACAAAALASTAATTATAATPTPARTAPEPALTVPTATLAAALHCYGPKLAGAARQPIMLVTGTGACGQEAYAIGKGAFDKEGRAVCTVDFPEHTTADIQVSVQYLVFGIRRMAKIARRPIGIIGISQGGLLPRVALTYRPSLRAQVTDVLAAAGTQHGTTVGSTGPNACSATRPCIPAGWQQKRGSAFLTALNRQADETPGPTAWTTIRSLDDETVQPQTLPHPTSALRGATNILIQAVCPGRKVGHIGTVLDSIAFAAFKDALAHPGPARVSRLPADVCDHPYAPGLDEAQTAALLSAANGLTAGRNSGPGAVTVRAEPKLRPWVRRLVS